MSSSSALEVELQSLAFGGDALGRLPDGRTVFVPFGLPGEKVAIRLVEDKARHARGEVVEILQASPERVEARCRHYGACGGCHYQHLAYPAQLASKQAILAEQLQRIARISNPPVQQSVASPLAWGYRNFMQFHQTSQGALGLLKPRSNEVFPLQECHLPEEALNAAWPLLEFEPIPGLERIGLRVGAGDDLQLILECNTPETPDLSIEDLPLSVVHLSPWGSLLLAGSQSVQIEGLGRPFRVSAGSFFQVNRRVAEAMVEHLLASLPLTPGVSLLELYCGVGLFSAFLAPRVARLVGVEASSQACSDFEYNLDEYDNVELYEAPAEHVIESLDIHADIVLVDPPRAGLGREVIRGLLAMQPQQIAYISCDAATLARDARALIDGGYHLAHITPFDVFPQTFHIESISQWVKAKD